MTQYSQSYWMQHPPLTGEIPHRLPNLSGIVIIGSGLSGVSVGYHLLKSGIQEPITLIDHQPEQSASYRNAGHILYGTVESMKAMVEIHGAEKAQELWKFSIDICEQVKRTVQELSLNVDYRQDGYLVNSISETEDTECKESVTLLNSMGFQSEYVDARTVRELGFRNCYGARFEAGSAQAHPVKFRNGVLKEFLKMGGKYYSNVQVKRIEEVSNRVEIHTQLGTIECEAAVVAANAYSPLFSDFFKDRGLIEPFRGQIIVSKPLKESFRVKYPHSFDHGYEYALVTPDDRLLIGGWRNHSKSGEIGTYSLEVNPYIEQGLKDFARDHYALNQTLEWDFSWSGIMAASRTGLPFIGSTSSPRIYACCAYTGHGFSWAHGSAQLLSDIILGNPLPKVSRYFNPKAIL